MCVVNWVLFFGERRIFQIFPAERNDFKRRFLLEGFVVKSKEVFLDLGELGLIISLGDFINDFGLSNGSESFDTVHDGLIWICEVSLGNYDCLRLNRRGFCCGLKLL